MVDLSNLKLTPELDAVVDFDNYVDPSEFPPPVPAGVYTLEQGKPTFEASKDGYLVAKLDHTVVGGDQDKAKVSFDRISDKPFERSGVKVSMMADQLRALGDKSRPRTHDEYAAAIEAGTGRPFKAQLDWEGGCNHKGTPQECEWNAPEVYRVKGEKNFPANANGGHLDSLKCPTCGSEVRARTKVNRRIPA